MPIFNFPFSGPRKMPEPPPEPQPYPWQPTVDPGMSAPELNLVQISGAAVSTSFTVYRRGISLIYSGVQTVTAGASITLPCAGVGSCKIGDAVTVYTGPTATPQIGLVITGFTTLHDDGTYPRVTLKNNSASTITLGLNQSNASGFVRLLNVSSPPELWNDSAALLGAMSTSSDGSGYVSFYTTEPVVDVLIGTRLFVDQVGGQIRERQMLRYPEGNHRLKPAVFNVLDFDSVQDALDKAYDGCTLYFPSGEYQSPSTGPWLITKQIRICGDNNTSPVNAAANRADVSTEGTVIRPGSMAFPVFKIQKGNSSNGISFERISIAPFIGTRSLTTTGTSGLSTLNFNTTSSLKIAVGQTISGTNIQAATTITSVVLNSSGTIDVGLSLSLTGNLSGAQSITFGAQFTSGGYGIMIDGTAGSGAVPSEIEIRNVAIGYTGDAGLYATTCNFLRIWAPLFQYCYGHGCVFTAINSVEIYSGNIQQNQKRGVFVDTVTDFSMFGTNVEINQREADAAQDADKDCQVYMKDSDGVGLWGVWFEAWSASPNTNRKTALTLDNCSGGVISGCKFIIGSPDVRAKTRGIYLMNKAHGIEVGSNVYDRNDVLVEIQASGGVQGNFIGHQHARFIDASNCRSLVVIPDDIVQNSNSPTHSGGNIAIFPPNGIVTTEAGKTGTTTGTIWKQQQIAGLILPTVSDLSHISNPHNGMLVSFNDGITAVFYIYMGGSWVIAAS